MNSLIFAIGTPSHTWFDPSLSVAESLNPEAEERFRAKLDEIFGSESRQCEGGHLLGASQIPSHEIRRKWEFSTLGYSHALLTDFRACWLANLLAASSTNCQVLAFYSAPAEYLASFPAGVDALAALAIWKEAAGRILELVRSQRSQITLVSVEECLAKPDAFRNLLHGKFEMPLWEIQPYKDLNPVRRVLAQAQVALDARLEALFAELNAASHPLASAVPPCATMSEALDEAWKYLESDSATRDTEHSLLLQKLHEAQEEIEALHLKQQDVEANLGEAIKSHEVAKCDYEAKLAAAKNEESALEKQLVELKKSSSTLSAQETKLKDAKEESEMLLLQLHQVQEELEHYFFENRRLEKARLVSGSYASRILQVEGLRIGPCQDAPPHRHLDFTLDQARLGDRNLGGVRMRLVEHNGRPGVLVFQGVEAELLYHWKSNGEENGKAFMLVIPQDDAGKLFLEAAPTSDILFLRESAQLLASELNASIEQGSVQGRGEWAGIAKRFVELADDVPQRLHYDHVAARAGEGDSRHFTIFNAWVPASGLTRQFEFLWNQNVLEFTRPAKAEPLLTNWPLDVAGRPLEKWMLDLNTRGDWGSQRQIWIDLTGKDREFLLHLLAELPNFIHHLAAQHPELKQNQDTLRLQAKRLLARARMLAAGRKPKRLLGLIPL